VTFHPHWLVPDWDAPDVGAVMTTRQGGVSAGPFESLNLRDGLGDDARAVADNQASLVRAIGVQPVYLNQVHGARVVRLGRADVLSGSPTREADASITTEAGIACAVQVADCLPVLFTAPRGRAVGAAHAGWRGLAHGVLEATVQALCDAAHCEPGQVQAWMGACIGPQQFEVGADVLQAFGAAFGASATPADAARFQAHRPGKWLANLPVLARDRLLAAGVLHVGGGTWCTVEVPLRFFSYRRDRLTGRMAALVWIRRPR
jgi:polyphenol oxidase